MTIFYDNSCDLILDTWDTDYIADNWEQQYKQLLCDLWIKSDRDGIRNSCDVFIFYSFPYTLEIIFCEVQFFWNLEILNQFPVFSILYVYISHNLKGRLVLPVGNGFGSQRIWSFSCFWTLSVFDLEPPVAVYDEAQKSFSVPNSLTDRFRDFFSVPHFSKTNSETFPVLNFSETDSRTFYGTKFFLRPVPIKSKM